MYSSLQMPSATTKNTNWAAALNAAIRRLDVDGLLRQCVLLVPSGLVAATDVVPLRCHREGARLLGSAGRSAGGSAGGRGADLPPVLAVAAQRIAEVRLGV